MALNEDNNKVVKAASTNTSLLSDVRLIVEQGLKTAYEGVNRVQISTYWQVGRRIVEEGNHRGCSLDPHSYGLGDGSLI